jgi:hypothetical protein
VVVYGNPNVEGVVHILPIYLVEIERVKHRLLNQLGVLVVSHCKPIVDLLLDPSLIEQDFKAFSASKKLGHKHIATRKQIV